MNFYFFSLFYKVSFYSTSKYFLIYLSMRRCFSNFVFIMLSPELANQIKIRGWAEKLLSFQHYFAFVCHGFKLKIIKEDRNELKSYTAHIYILHVLTFFSSCEQLSRPIKSNSFFNYKLQITESFRIPLLLHDYGFRLRS